MKPWMLVGAVCAALVGVWGCGDSSADSDEAVVVGQERNGQTVELAVGTPLSVELAGNPTTGYEWTVAQIDSACLRLAGSTYTADSSAIGSGGTYVFRFEPLRAGRTVLGLVYRRAWEITAADQTFTLTVDVRAAGDNPPSAAALENTRWKLAAWSASSLNPAGFDVTAEFADGRIGGRSGVNRYGGDYSAAADGEFSVGALAMTEMAGDPAAMQAESLYHALLAQADRWRIAQAQLVLSAAAQDLLIFDPR
ncbi:MAG TPA: protease inhibitor I42 family protein [Kiritimatiellia bacterium]|nr:protease inhibitor I42 family protein [Kiritimatiellia bacterium]